MDGSMRKRIQYWKIQEGMTSQENDPYEEAGSTFAEDCN